MDFKKSTATLGIQIQCLMSRALDEDNHCIIASFDLSSAFDVVNISLLLKRLRVVGLPVELVALIEIWLTDRVFYVEVNGTSSIVSVRFSAEFGFLSFGIQTFNVHNIKRHPSILNYT